MAITIANQSRHLVIVPLNSGDTIHLAPGEVSRAIDDLQVQRNPDVDKLVQKNLIEVLSEEGESTAPRKAGLRRAKTK